MKDLINYISILESSKYFTLDDGERDALGTLIGVLCGSLGDEEDEEELKPVKKELSNDEINQLSDLFDFLDNTETRKRFCERIYEVVFDYKTQKGKSKFIKRKTSKSFIK